MGVDRRQPVVLAQLTSLNSEGVLTPLLFENRICYWLTDEV